MHAETAEVSRLPRCVDQQRADPQEPGLFLVGQQIRIAEHHAALAAIVFRQPDRTGILRDLQTATESGMPLFQFAQSEGIIGEQKILHRVDNPPRTPFQGRQRPELRTLPMPCHMLRPYLLRHDAELLQFHHAQPSAHERLFNGFLITMQCAKPTSFIINFS